MVFDIGTFCKLKGYRVQLKVNTEEYEGVITNVVAATSCITLGKARCLTDGIYYHVLYFFIYEIESCVTLNGPEDLKKVPKKPNNFTEEDGPRLVKLRPLPFHERGKPHANVHTDNLLIGGAEDEKQSGYLLDDISDKSDDDDDDDILPSEKFKYPVPGTNVVIDTINDDFHEAITNIMKETTIGVSLEGANIGRHGKVCLLSASTESHVYLFDISTLGKDAFDKGLKKALQNPSIMKIFHDCREPSDVLFHQFDVRLINIFDTQSSDALLQYKVHHRMPRYVRSLGTCLSYYLKLDVRIPEFSRSHHQQYSEKDLSVWICRPLPKRFVKAAAKHCMFLKELRYAILERYIADLNRGAEIFLGIVRDSSEQELDLSRSALHMLPEVFQKLEIKATHQSYEVPSHAPHFRFLRNTYDPYAAASKNLWFKQDTFHKKEPVAVRTGNKVSQKIFEDEQCGDNRSSEISNRKIDTESGLSKTNGSLGYSSLTKEKCAPARCESQSSYGASPESEKQSCDVLSRYENQFYARSSPKKRIDWPKVSSQKANVAMIPAGMMPPSVQYPKKQQGS